MRFLTVTLLVLLSVTFGLRAEEQPAQAALNDGDKKKAASLLTDLGADDFQVRENAEKSLSGMGAAVLPLVKETAGSTNDAEVRTRCEHVIQSLALESENNPDELAKLAKAAAEGKKFADAAKFYAKAAQLYKTTADKSTDDKQKADVLAKAAKATERQQRADLMAKSDVQTNGGQIIVNGGGRIRVIRQGGLVMTATASSDGSDW